MTVHDGHIVRNIKVVATSEPVANDGVLDSWYGVLVNAEPPKYLLGRNRTDPSLRSSSLSYTFIQRDIGPNDLFHRIGRDERLDLGDQQFPRCSFVHDKIDLALLAVRVVKVRSDGDTFA